MNKPRKPRLLRPEERRVWALVAMQVAPLPGRALPPEPEPEPSRPAAASPEPAAAAAVAARPGARSPPPLAALERKTVLSLKSGKRRADAVIDLHGMRQAEAHGALIAFLHRSQNAGHAIVLVVTGKGGAGAGDGLFEERGVLRRMAPHWLRLPDLRPLVLGFEEAALRHGGSGALYVRLRRRRGEPA